MLLVIFNSATCYPEPDLRIANLSSAFVKGERIFIEIMTLDRKLEASREGSE